MPRLLSVLFMAAGLAVVAPSVASAADETITFNSAPAVVGQGAGRIYQSSPGVVLGELPNLPSSSTIKNTSSCGVTVANVDGHATPVGALGCGGSTEFRDPATLIGTFTIFTRTKVSMTVGDSGLDKHPSVPHAMRVLAYDGNGKLISTGQTKTIPKGGTELSVSAGLPEIAFFILEDTAPTVDSGVWVDDITFDVPPTKGTPAFRAIRTNPGTVGLYQGQPDTNVDITLFRLNGSNGNVKYTVAGLPHGVRATQVASVNGKALALTVDPKTPVVLDYDHIIKVTVSPLDAGAGQPTSTAEIPIQVQIFPAMSLGISDATATLPDCGRGGVDLSYLVKPWAGPATWSITGSPSGFTPLLDGRQPADWLKSSVTGSGKVRLTWEQTAPVTAPTTIKINLRGSGFSSFNDDGSYAGSGSYTADTSQTLVAPAPLKDVYPTAVKTPRELKPGTTVTIYPDGVCSGANTRVRFGNDKAMVTPTAGGDGSILAEVPRLATSGPIQVIPDAIAAPGVFFFGPNINVDSYRNTVGFAFHNYTPNLTVDQMSAAFGYDATHYTTNICGTFTFGLIKCKVSTPLPDPWATTVLTVANMTMGGGLTSHGGACFGFSRTSQQLRQGSRPIASLGNPSATNAFTYDHRDAGRLGGGGAAEAINANQLTQLSNEYLGFYAREAVGNALSQHPGDVFREISDAFKRGEDPVVSLRRGGSFGDLHAVIAYDLENDPVEPGGFYIDVYDSNAPFLQAGHLEAGTPYDEEGSDGVRHESQLGRSRIHVHGNGAWDLRSTADKDDGPIGSSSVANLIISDSTMPPAKPTLITATNAAKDGVSIFLGWTAAGLLSHLSEGDEPTPEATAPSAHIAQVTSGGRSLFSSPGVVNSDPATALRATPWAPATGGSGGAEGIILAQGQGAAYSVSLTGDTAAPQTRTVLGQGMVGTVTTNARPGVTDQIAVAPNDDKVGFTAGAASSPLDLQMMVRTGDGSTRSVQAKTTTPAKASDAVSFGAGDTQIEMAHQGPPATVAVTLSSTGAAGVPEAATASVKVGANSTTTVKPANWKDLGGSSITIKSKGKSRTAKLRRVRGTGARVVSVSADKPASKGAARIGKATVTVPPAITSGNATVTFVLRRGKQTIETKSMDAGAPGTRTLTWTLPSKAKRGDQLSVVATTLIPMGKVFNSSTSTKTAKLKG